MLPHAHATCRGELGSHNFVRKLILTLWINPQTCLCNSASSVSKFDMKEFTPPFLRHLYVVESAHLYDMAPEGVRARTDNYITLEYQRFE